MMSGSGNEEAATAGVVRNSALSFVAPAQASNTIQNQTAPEAGHEEMKDPMEPTDRVVPAGLKALYEECSKVYPDQPNPLQVTTRLKYWLGGQDPLDYISMYWNPGKPEEHIPPHWHYISFGLSDLHGDGRVHPVPERVSVHTGRRPSSACGGELTRRPGSGYGVELTLRLAGPAPPVWPAAMMQSLARYVFTTGNKFCAGDHISWHAPLDGSVGPARSRIRHLLVTEDPVLGTVDTAHGTVTFLQLVGCTSRELRAAQRGSGFEVLKEMKDPSCSGPWLVTSPCRRRSSRPAPPRAPRAHLAGVSANVRWTHCTFPPSETAPRPAPLPPSLEEQIKITLQRGLSSMSTDRSEPQGHKMSTDSFEMSSMERALPEIPDLMQGSWRDEETVEHLDGAHILMNPEAASLLPLAIDGRVSAGCHFTWAGAGGAVSVLAPAVRGAAARARGPAARGRWLQIVIPKDLAEDMSKKVSNLSRLAETDSETEDEGSERDGDMPTLPLVLSWPEHRFKISVVHDHELL